LERGHRKTFLPLVVGMFLEILKTMIKVRLDIGLTDYMNSIQTLARSRMDLISVTFGHQPPSSRCWGILMLQSEHGQSTMPLKSCLVKVKNLRPF
jgi:hypothetical protein